MADNWVKLNVGGKLFTTTKSTLSQGSTYFASLFNGSFAVVKDESGAVLIDRSPVVFEYLLELLRTGHLLLPDSPNIAKAVQIEAEFYGITLPTPTSSKAPQQALVVEVDSINGSGCSAVIAGASPPLDGVLVNALKKIGVNNRVPQALAEAIDLAQQAGFRLVHQTCYTDRKYVDRPPRFYLFFEKNYIL